jgi:hypothetical protein
MSDRPARYGMILLEPEPTILRSHGRPVIFGSIDETIEYAALHDVQRWMVFGDPDGWWPLYTQAGPMHPPPPTRERVDISLRRQTPAGR